MTKLNKVLLGTGIILLIYSLENLSTATSFIWLIFAIIILAVSIGNKQQTIFSKGKSNIITGIGIAMSLVAFIYLILALLDSSHFPNTNDFIWFVTRVALFFTLGIAVLLIGIKAKKQSKQLQLQGEA